MLSFLYRLIRGFQREHGFPPNVVYLNSLHYGALRDNLSTLTHEQAENFLRLHIVLDTETLHPHVAWQEQVHSPRAAVRA
jgi:hypothetical protein